MSTAALENDDKKDRKEEKTEKEEKKKDSYAEFFNKRHETAKGLITIHKMDGKVYFEMPDSVLGREMLLGSTVSEISDNANAIVGSKPYDPWYIKFAKADGKILMLDIGKSNISRNPGDGIDKALRKSDIDAIMKAFKIETCSPDSTRYVIDVTDLFLADEKELSPFDPNGLYSGRNISRNESFKPANSYVKEIKSFSDNVTVKSVLSYTYSVTRDKKKIIEDEPFTAVMTRSLVLLPEIPARPRITDSRMSVFPVGLIAYDSGKQTARNLFYAYRWRLEPSDTAAFLRGEKVAPKKPVVFYIDSAFPEAYRPFIKEGVSQWNEMFGTIGFKDAIQARDFPDDDPEFDPDNIKYSCIRYAPTPVANAMGPSWVDPRSGEIISASVYVYHNVIKLLNNWIFVQTAAADPDVRKVELPAEVIGDGLRYVISHEIGHCLGFMHNMSGSAVVPVDSLRSPTYTQKHGTTTSIMDYARFNYIAQPGDKEAGVKLTPPRFGVYDEYALKWNYTPVFEAKDMWDEYEVTSNWLHEAYRSPLYRYGKQQGTVIDPRSQTEDLGDDAVKASDYGIRNLRYILGNLDSWVGGQDYDYSFRTSIYESIVNQYFMYMNHVYGNIGGIYLQEKMEGDAGKLYESVPANRQKAAFDYLAARLGDLEWIDDKALLEKLPLMGSPARILRNAIFAMLLKSPDKVDLSASVAEGRAYTPEECLEDLFDFVWAPTKDRKSLTESQIMFQNMFLKHAGKSSGVKIGGGGADSLSEHDGLEDILGHDHDIFGCRHMALPVAAYNEPSAMYHVPKSLDGLWFNYILEVKKLVSSRKNSGDEATRSHYKLILKDIEKAL